METLFKILCSLACEAIILWLFKLFSHADRSAIIELGYRSASKQFRPLDKSTPLWDRLFHFSLCKKAKKFKASVWLYFACNLLVVISSVGSVILTCVLVLSEQIREIFLYQLMYMFVVIFIWLGMHFILDLFFLPSEQKRYGKK